MIVFNGQRAGRNGSYKVSSKRPYFSFLFITLQMRKRRRSKILPESFMQILFWVELQKQKKQGLCSLELKFQLEEHQRHSVIDGDKW